MCYSFDALQGFINRHFTFIVAILIASIRESLCSLNENRIDFSTLLFLEK